MIERGAISITVREGDIISVDESIDIVVKKRSAGGFRLVVVAPKTMLIKREPSILYTGPVGGDNGPRFNNDGRYKKD